MSKPTIHILLPRIKDPTLDDLLSGVKIELASVAAIIESQFPQFRVVVHESMETLAAEDELIGFGENRNARGRTTICSLVHEDYERHPLD